MKRRNDAEGAGAPPADAATAYGRRAAQVLKAVAFLLAPVTMIHRWTDRMRELAEGGDQRALWKFLGKSFLFMMMIGFFFAGTPLARAIAGMEPWVAMLLVFPILGVVEYIQARGKSVAGARGDPSQAPMRRQMPDGL